MDESSSLWIGPDPNLGVNLWDGRSPFSLVTSFQSRAQGRGEWTTRTMVKNWGLGAWQAQYAVSWSSTVRPYLGTGLTLRVTMRICDQGGPQAWRGQRATLLSTTQNANPKISGHGEGFLISASCSTLGSDWRKRLGSEA